MANPQCAQAPLASNTASSLSSDHKVLRWTLAGTGIGVGAAALVAAGSSALATYFARRVITPTAIRVEDQEILAVVQGKNSLEVILKANDDVTVPGTYSLFFDQGRGHARIGRILSYAPAEGTVSREVQEVYSGDLKQARRGYWSGATYPNPQTLGYPAQEVLLDVTGGQAPAWLVEPAADARQQPDIWAIMIHGRGASRLEGLRSLKVARELGLTSLLISYRNDGEAPLAQDGRYGLGSTEWEDVEAAIAFALSSGAKEVVLFGWSMGGAIALQTADLSRNRGHIRAMVLDAPVINWVTVLAHHAQLNRIPSLVGRYGQMILTHPVGRRLTGLAAPVNLKSMDWVARAVELRTPTLILHSVDDEYVPYGPSAHLAQKNPEIVTFVPFETARHTKEWNVDPQKWDETVSSWLLRELKPKNNPGSSRTGD
ncbi:alpha/beta hydrolase family protein [Pseudarthrobacter sp. J1738]|uniref:alpha/beta hydrolase family protein n=1 Tax=unclassified Pseudarthrobacter TaxID=2647000 RepID=UPI003D2D29CE